MSDWTMLVVQKICSALSTRSVGAATLLIDLTYLQVFADRATVPYLNENVYYTCIFMLKVTSYLCSHDRNTIIEKKKSSFVTFLSRLTNMVVELILATY